jgi:hypothetical protein
MRNAPSGCLEEKVRNAVAGGSALAVMQFRGVVLFCFWLDGGLAQAYSASENELQLQLQLRCCQ